MLIEVNPQTRIPRTFSRFAGLFVQLLHKFSVKASDSSIRLLKVIKNPITDHLPIGCKKILMSYTGQKVAKPSELVPNTDEPVCVVIGAIARGKDLNDGHYIYCLTDIRSSKVIKFHSHIYFST